MPQVSVQARSPRRGSRLPVFSPHQFRHALKMPVQLFRLQNSYYPAMSPDLNPSVHFAQKNGAALPEISGRAEPNLKPPTNQAYPTRIWNVVEAVMLPSETFTVMLELPVFPRVGVTFTVLSDAVPPNVTRDITAG